MYERKQDLCQFLGTKTLKNLGPLIGALKYHQRQRKKTESSSDFRIPTGFK